jgi:hypothetical protein
MVGALPAREDLVEELVDGLVRVAGAGWASSVSQRSTNRSQT